jgi:eukaryotic-like serine/threonine-protein kinase
MGEPDEVLMKAADSIAAGDGVDWQRLQQQPIDADESRTLAEMQILERIATFLRSPDAPDTSAVSQGSPTQPAGPASWAHFTIIESIGQGGFGIVYRARDTKLQADVALKLIELPLDREVRPASALKEARLLARVRHANVVTVHGADIVDGKVGIWMQLVEGQTLSSLLRANGPFGAHEAALIGIDLCRALAAVHGAGLVHGDVKTRNVMREAGGRTVLMDFGTGTDLSALRLHGAREGVSGTPVYLAPEAFEGQARSRVSDIYSLGVLLFHLVTDTYPVNGQTQAEVEAAHRRGERTRLRDTRPDLPQSFVALVECALSRDPLDRFQTAGAFETALADFLGQKRPIDPQPHRSRWWWANAAAIIVALIAVVGAAVLVGRRTGAGERSAVTAPPAAAAPAAATTPSYRIEAALYKRGGNDETRLHQGDRVAPGDALFMRLHASAPTYVYIVNEDEQGEAFLLFPLPGLAVDNPIAAGTPIRVPGTANEEVSWKVTSLGKREHFLVFASPERLEAFEEMFATLPRPEFGKPVTTSAKIPNGTLSKLRGVGGLTAPSPASKRVRLSNVFTSPAGDGEQTAHGLWVRQLTVDNPPAGR